MKRFKKNDLNAPASPAALREDFSQRIAVLRFPLLFLIVCVHARFYGEMMVGKPEPKTYMWLQETIFPQFLIVAVAAFFIISGYLITFKLEDAQTQPLKFYLKKIKTLLVPYLIWNTLLFIPHYLLPKLLGSASFLPKNKFEGMGVLNVVGKTYGITAYRPIDEPLWYMRNVFVFTFLTPLWLPLMRRLGKWPGLALAGALIVWQPEIGAGFFLLGAWLGLHPVNLHFFDRSRQGWLALFIALTLLAQFNVFFSEPLYYIVTLILFYAIGGAILRLPKISAACMALSTGTFFLYCAHAPVATTLDRLFLMLGINAGWQFFISYWIVVLATLLICHTAFIMIASFAPGFLAIISGGRIQKKS